MVTILMSALVIATHSRGPSVHAAGTPKLHACTVGTLQGRYGDAVSGFINNSTNPNDVTIPTFVAFAEEAFYDFDGRGNISGAFSKTSEKPALFVPYHHLRARKTA